ncbi:MAG: PAS domain-containing protein [Ktedonobacteraceae bacterium]|nr:PAS domain-containing protein [Ktedonobacteraceae bacterium]
MPNHHFREAHYRLAIEAAGVGLWEWILASDTHLWTAQCRAHFGLQPDEDITYEKLLLLFHPDDRERVHHLMQSCLANHEDYHTEYRVIWPDGSLHWIEARGQGIYTATGQAIALIGVTCDITSARARFEEKQDAFICMASHELRTPLTTIRGNLQLIERRMQKLGENEPLGKEGKKQVLLYTQRALQLAEVECRLLNDLLDTTLIRGDLLQIVPEPYDLCELVRNVINDHQTLCQDHPLHVSIPETSLLVMLDRTRIGEVIIHYLLNALKQTPASKPISLGINVTNTSSARFWIQDQGPGFTHDEQTYAWDRFASMHDFTAYKIRGGGGLGLELYISRAIIRQHGGSVGVDSRPGQGATFWFTLPLYQPSEDSHAHQDKPNNAS